jgi:surface antigen
MAEARQSNGRCPSSNKGGRRTIIRNQKISADDALLSITNLKDKILSGNKNRKTNKRPNMTVFAAYGGVFLIIVSIITVGYQPPQPSAGNSSVANATANTPTITPDSADRLSVDEIVATDVALNLAEQTNMAVAPNVANLSVSLAAKNELSQTNDNAIVKPTIIQPTIGNGEIITYVVKQGDSAATIAASFGLKPETVRWANNLSTDAVTVGASLTIPPTDGVIYTVRAGDTIDKLATTYTTTKERITSVNNLEISGLTPGKKIVIPGGILPTEQRPGYVAPVQQRTYTNTGTGFGGSSWRIKVGTPGLAGNGYAYGNCTRYAYDRRIQLGLKVGNQWGNASTWSYYAQREGLRVDNSPSVGAVIQNGGGFGHVGIVEKLLPNGDIEISEMNAYVSGGGWNIVSGRTISASQVRYYAYIH